MHLEDLQEGEADDSLHETYLKCMTEPGMLTRLPGCNMPEMSRTFFQVFSDHLEFSVFARIAHYRE